MVGGNFQHDQTHNLLEVETGTTSSNIAGRHFTFVNNIGDSPSINTYGVFGSVDYKITDTVTARGSARYTSVSNQHEGCTADSGRGDLAAAFAGLSSLLSGSPTAIAPGQCVTLDATTFKPVGLIKQKLDEHNVSWRVGLDWKVTPDALLYANIAKGYKSGAWTNTAAALSSQIAPVKQESILAYEAGLKSTFARDRLQLNLSAFYYDYTDKQLGGYVNVPPFGALPTLVSIPKSKVYGAEAQIDALLTPLLKAQLSAAYTYTRVQADPQLPIDPFGNPTSFVGESFPQTPRYQLNLNVEQTIPVSDRVEGYLGGDVAYRSSASSTFGRDSSQLSREVFSLPAYTLLGLRAGVRFDHGKTGLEIWGHNVTDTFYTSSIVKPGDAVVRFVGFPRTFGIRLYWRN
jgi:outer membrane receptor protein involved in Fe transport